MRHQKKLSTNLSIAYIIGQKYKYKKQYSWTTSLNLLLPTLLRLVLYSAADQVLLAGTWMREERTGLAADLQRQRQA